MQDTGAAVNQLRRGEHLVGYGRGEDLTRTGRIQHAQPHESAVKRLMTRSSA